MASRLATRRNQVPVQNQRSRTLKDRHRILEAAEKDAPKTLHFGTFLNANFKHRLGGLGILAFYLLIRFGFGQQMDSLGEYATYIFEALFTLVVGFLYWDRIQFRSSIKNDLALGFGPALVLGFLIELATKPLGLSVPFDVSGVGAIAMLVFFGPVLEELIFRMALWNPLLDLGQKGESRQGTWVAAVTTSLVFAYGHYHVSWFLPEGDIRNFVLYQTIYVLLLAGHCAIRLVKTNSILSPIFVHIGFNLGFFLALRFIS